MMPRAQIPCSASTASLIPLRVPMLCAFVPIERVLNRFGWHIRCHFQALHEGLRPRAIRASPIRRCLCRQHDRSGSRRVSHASNSTLIHTDVVVSAVGILPGFRLDHLETELFGFRARGGFSAYAESTLCFSLLAFGIPGLAPDEHLRSKQSSNRSSHEPDEAKRR